MLGKIFEELVTGRHETGSYYTPKPVVSFMCRQALKGYLQRSCPSETMPALDQFVEKRNPSGLINPESILRVLREIKVCDPACGSGAYLLGMLHELLDLRAALFSIHQLDARTIYDRKLEIIQKNLYGVDKDSFTVNIARLRLWLSLVVDDPRNPLEQPDLDVALPNLDFKIESGDSLTAPDPTDGLANLSADFIKQFQNAKDLFGFTHGSNKRNLYQDVIDIKTKIQAWSGRTANNDEFDWRVEFAEIYSNEDSSKRGFDVVLANPPYVRADAQFRHIEDEQERQVEIVKWKGYREQLIGTKTYKTFYEKWDLYIPFLERAFQLLRQDGQMVFIIPDAYNSAKYAKKSHEFFLQLSRIERIDFCSEINLFSAGVNNTILHFTKERASADHCPVRMRRWGKNKEEFEDNFEILSTYNQATGKEMIFRNNYATYQDCNRKNDTQNYDFIPLTQIVYISYGLRANADDSEWRGEFKTEDCISSVMDEKHPKKFLQGKNIEKWKNSSMQYLEWGTERAPSKFARPTFKQLYDVPEKLIATKVSLKPKVAYDSEQYIHSDGGISFVPWHYLSGIVNRSIKKTSQYSHQFPEGDRKSRESISQQFNLKYILGILNSEYAISLLAQHRRNKLQLYPDDWKQFPIALITMDEQMEFVKLVDEILAVFEQHGYPLAMEQERHVFELERRLDKMVTNLYEK